MENNIELENLKFELGHAKDALGKLGMARCKFWRENKCEWIGNDEYCKQCSEHCCYVSCRYSIDNDYNDAEKCSAQCILCMNLFCIKCVNSATNYKCGECLQKL